MTKLPLPEQWVLAPIDEDEMECGEMMLRNVEGVTIRVRKMPVPDMHALTRSEVNIDEE